MSDTKVVILSVNYNSDNYALNFVANLNKFLNDNIQCILIDNSSRKSARRFFSSIKKRNDKVECVKPEFNLGYFGGAKYGFEYYLQKNKKYPDWIIVSNVDLEFTDPDFFNVLSKFKQFPDLGVVAPRIWSNIFGRDINPKILQRPSKHYMRFLNIIFNNYYTYTVYALLSYLKSIILKCKEALILPKINLRPQNSHSDFTEIYAPHGSFIIFHKRFFQKGGSLDYPPFLFGEEIFVAETARKLKLKIIYFPKLRMLDYEHVSTGLIKNKKNAGYFRESMNFIIDQYFS